MSRVQINRVNGALGIPPAASSDVLVLVGPSSLGAPNSIVDFGDSTPLQVRTTLGFGPLPSYAAAIMATPNHGRVICVPVTQTVGVAGAPSSAGTTPPVMTVTGTPIDGPYTLQARCVTAGAGNATSAVQYSLDGVNWSDAVSTASSYVVPNTGLTVSFANTAFNLDNTWSVACTPPSASDANITAALAALRASGRNFGWCHVITWSAGASDAARATAAAATFAAISAEIALFRQAGKQGGFSMEAPAPVATDAAGLTSWRTALTSSTMTALANDSLSVMAGYHLVQSQLETRRTRRPAGYSVMRRMSQAAISESLGRKRSGGIADVLSLEHDELVTGGLAPARYTTLCVRSGGAVCVFLPNVFRTANSDYARIQNVRVMGRAIEVANAALEEWLQEDLNVDRTTGFIQEADARAIESDIEDKLESALQGHVSTQNGRPNLAVKVSRTDDILRTGNLTGEGSIQPKGYAENITFSFGFARTIN